MLERFFSILLGRIKTEMQSAWKVGMLVLGFAASLVGAYAVLGRSLFAEPVDQYQAVFADAGGVVAGSPVMLSGVRVGQVASVRLTGPRTATLELALKMGTPVPQGTQAVIASSLIGIGDRPIELRAPEGSTALLSPGATLQGAMQSPLESLAPESRETLQALNATLKATQGLLEDQKMRGRVVDLLESSNKTVTEFGVLASQINKVVAQNQGEVQAALMKAGKMLDDLSVATQAVARIAGDGKMEGKVTALLDEMNATMKQSNALVADLRKTVNDPELQGPVKEILANTKTMTESGTKIASNAEEMTKNGITLSEKAIEIADKASKLADELSSVLKKFDQALGSVAGIARPGGGISNIETQATLTRETNPGRFRTDFEAKIPFRNDSFTIGMYDAFEGNKLIAQFGRPVNPNLNLRYGVFASKPGVGVDFRLAPAAWLRGDLYDVNDPRFDVRARIDFNRDLNGWLGIERIFERPAPSFGIGIRR